MGQFFDELKEGLEEAIDYEKGKKPLRVKLVQHSPPPKTYSFKAIFVRFLNLFRN